MAYSDATVVAATELTERMRRITLGIADPGALAVDPGADSAVGVYLTGAVGRHYSVRHHRPADAEIDIDVVLHVRGPGTAWALEARAGDRVGLDHARSWYRPPPATDWQLLVTDLSGLPATARIIEQLSGGLPVTALVEVAAEEDLAYLPAHPDVTVVPSLGSGNGSAPSRLAHLVREFATPDGSGYCWFGGEAAESRAVRKHFRAAGWTVDQLDVTGYWRLGSEEWDARYALVADEVVAVYTRALAEGKGAKVADAEFDAALERVGL
jgi:NADPH-dependent ferric siderophore reductase